ncbi:hypothetical protein AND_003870 [Anopheles darlingi]|uniref:Uncharacterized protein n=1 Tax=Anopheles darlingi TaxID=43151 RepID=W5JNF4_ANODA|nr:hypothetical protein AND_003870 [Anopheles darlingi]
MKDTVVGLTTPRQRVAFGAEASGVLSQPTSLGRWCTSHQDTTGISEPPVPVPSLCSQAHVSLLVHATVYRISSYV